MMDHERGMILARQCRILPEFGRGGMSTVSPARDEHVPQRYYPSALKILHASD